MKTTGRATLAVLLLLGGAGVIAACGSDDETVAEESDGGNESGVDSSRLDSSVADTSDANDAGDASDASDAVAEGGRTLDGGSCGGDAVSIASITPQFAWKDGPTPITISGTGFVATPKVYVRASTGALTQIEHVAFVSATSLNAVIPAGVLTSGTYEIAVVNANTCAGGLTGVLRVVDQAPPTVLEVSPAAGTTQNDVPVTIKGCNFDANAAVSVVSAAGTVTVMVAPTANVAGAADPRCGGGPLYTLTAKIETKTKALPVGPYLVRITNPTPNTFGDYSVFVVTNPSGNLAAAEVGSPLVNGRRSLALVAGRINDASRFLFAIGGENAAGVPYDTVEVAPLDRFGQLGKWAVQKNKLTAARSGAAAVRYGSWIYVLGGTSSTDGTKGVTPNGTPRDTVERAKILDPSFAPAVTDPPTLSTAAGTLAKGTWYYRVTAIGSDPDDPGGESVASSEVIANLSANGTVTLNWTAIAGVTAYRVYRSKTPDAVAGGEVFLAQVNALTYPDNGSAVQAADAAPYPVEGSTGVWTQLASTFGTGGTGRLDSAAVVAKDPAGDPYLYLTGGFGRCTGDVANKFLGCIEVAPVNADGTLGAFVVGTPLGTPRLRHGAAVLDQSTGPAAFTAGGATATTAFLVVGGGRHGAAFDGAKNVEYSLIGAGGVLGAFAYPTASFSSERDGSQFQLANGYGYAFVGGTVGSYTATSDQSAVTLTSSAVTFPTWSNAGANLGGANKRGRLGVTAESAYFYLVGGTSNDTDALNTVFRILH
jgi:hypothetical protein